MKDPSSKSKDIEDNNFEIQFIKGAQNTGVDALFALNIELLEYSKCYILCITTFAYNAFNDQKCQNSTVGKKKYIQH